MLSFFRILLLVSIVLGPLLFGCRPHSESYNRCLLGILNDPQLKQATDELGGARLRSKICGRLVKNMGPHAAYREQAELIIHALVLHRAAQRQSW